MINQLVRAGRLDRSFYTNLLFDDYATGNAVAIVALLAAVPILLKTLDPFLALRIGIRALVRAALVAIAAWAVATRMFEREGRIPTSIRLIGYAHIALIPIAVIVFFPSLEFPMLALAVVWFFLAARVVAEVQFDLPQSDATIVGGAAAGAWFILFRFIPLF